MVYGLQKRSDGKAKGGLQRVREGVPSPSGGVVVAAEDVVRALVKADGPMKRDSWSGMAMLRRPECEPVAVRFSRTVGALLKP